MLHIVGAQQYAEYEAAATLWNVVVQTWPLIVDDGEHARHIIVGGQCRGQQARTVNILLLVSFGPCTPFLPFVDTSGAACLPSAVAVHHYMLQSRSTITRKYSAVGGNNLHRTVA